MARWQKNVCRYSEHRTRTSYIIVSRADVFGATLSHLIRQIRQSDNTLMVVVLEFYMMRINIKYVDSLRLVGSQCTRTRECECSLLLCRQLTSSERRTDRRTEEEEDGRTEPHHGRTFCSVRPSVHRPLAPRTAGSVRPPREGGKEG